MSLGLGFFSCWRSSFCPESSENRYHTSCLVLSSCPRPCWNRALHRQSPAGIESRNWRGKLAFLGLPRLPCTTTSPCIRSCCQASSALSRTSPAFVCALPSSESPDDPGHRVDGRPNCNHLLRQHGPTAGTDAAAENVAFGGTLLYNLGRSILSFRAGDRFRKEPIRKRGDHSSCCIRRGRYRVHFCRGLPSLARSKR